MWKDPLKAWLKYLGAKEHHQKNTARGDMNSGHSPPGPAADVRSAPRPSQGHVLIGRRGILPRLVAARCSVPTAAWTSLRHIVVSVKYN